MRRKVLYLSILVLSVTIFSISPTTTNAGYQLDESIINVERPNFA
ncbi:hypothetical protein [Ferdinandcohnia sp. Marseille-Q9671]